MHWRFKAAIDTADRFVGKSFSKKKIRKSGNTPIVSFTFDDCPRSAIQNGGSILAEYGARGTFFIALGMIDSNTILGESFSAKDLVQAVSDGHELGSHTYDHFDARNVSFKDYKNSILRNDEGINKLIPGVKFQTFSYPYGGVTRRARRFSGQRFRCARSIIQGINIGDFDLNLLMVFSLYSWKFDLKKIKPVIDETCETGGWLIFYTHDISSEPSRFGSTTKFFESVVKYAVDCGATVYPVSHAIELIEGGA